MKEKEEIDKEDFCYLIEVYPRKEEILPNEDYVSRSASQALGHFGCIRIYYPATHPTVIGNAMVFASYQDNTPYQIIVPLNSIREIIIKKEE